MNIKSLQITIIPIIFLINISAAQNGISSEINIYAGTHNPLEFRIIDINGTGAKNYFRRGITAGLEYSISKRWLGFNAFLEYLHTPTASLGNTSFKNDINSLFLKGNTFINFLPNNVKFDLCMGGGIGVLRSHVPESFVKFDTVLDDGSTGIVNSKAIHYSLSLSTNISLSYAINDKWAIKGNVSNDIIPEYAGIESALLNSINIGLTYHL